eukprot:6478420-Alexandrium_andersonii.AAC.1
MLLLPPPRRRPALSKTRWAASDKLGSTEPRGAMRLDDTRPIANAADTDYKETERCVTVGR